ncbi:uncharacterized protein LOC116800456 [Drosophila sechellia]|uniref:uncharacterized protein LOC116800456 n=1 Tax=Drosophila sechellia TaxID=7238 RepID=UPI0013DE001B|nr:uncharacterized protein LOC116800456 [Drosophila sechellia]
MAYACGLLLLAILAYAEVACHSVQFGILHFLAVPIYEAEIFTTEFVDFVDVKYKQKGSMCFHINMILVVDESEMEWKVQASVLSGGIGYNFTILRLTVNPPEVAKVTVVIYGIPR